MNFILSLVLVASCVNSNVLIIGDSQADTSSWGGALEGQYEECGAEVERHTYTGYSTTRIMNLTDQNPEDFDIVILITGDNDNNRTQHLASIVEFADMMQTDTNTVYYNLPYRRTRVGSMSAFSAVFPGLAQYGPDYWITGSAYQDHLYYRELMRTTIEEETEAMLMDIESIAVSNDYNIPNFRDGIHIPRNVAVVLAGFLFPGDN